MSKVHRQGVRRRCRQEGGAMVEFAFVFPLLFALIYGTIVYAYVFVINESVHFAAKTGAESAVRVDPQVADYATVLCATVRSTVAATLNWLPEAQKLRVLGENGEKVGCTPAAGQVEVVVDFEVTTPTPVLPVVPMPLVGSVPPLPERLRASAVALI